MTRWWSVPALLSVPVLVHLAAPRAAASIHSNLTIIMTTLGTDGTTTTTTSELPPGSSVTVMSSDGMSSVGVPTPPSDEQSPVPSTGASGGSGNPGVDGPSATPDTTTNSPEATTDTSTDETGPPPPPPVLEPTTPETPTTPTPDAPVDPVTPETLPSDTPEVTTGVSETPEPGTLTLMGLAVAGGLGYARRRRKAA